MRLWSAAAAAVFAVFLAQPAAAQTQQDEDACNGRPPRFTYQQTIAGCTTIIQSGAADTANLSGFYSNRGVAYNYLGQHANAIADYNQAIRLNPGNYLAFSNRGASYLAQGDYALAIADLDQAIRLNPNAAEAYFNRGLAYVAQSNSPRAVADFDQAIRLEPSNPDAYAGRAEARVGLRDYEGAWADTNQAIALDTGHARAYLVRSLLQTAAGEFDLALQDIDHFIRSEPQEPAGPKIRAMILEEKVKAGAAALPAGASADVLPWGMSSAAVAALYPGGTQPLGPNYYSLQKTGQFRGFSYRWITFDFVNTGEGLERVSIESTEPVATLRRKLTARYGAPTSERRPNGGSDRFTDRASGDKIVLAFNTGADWASVTWIAGRSPRVAQAVAPGQPPQWRSPLSEFKTNFPAARQLMEGSIFWGLDGPRLHGRNWKRGNFSYPGDDLSEYTLFSSDSYDAVIADFAARYGPARGDYAGGRGFIDAAAGSILTVRRNADGTAIMNVRPNL